MYGTFKWSVVCAYLLFMQCALSVFTNIFVYMHLSTCSEGGRETVNSRDYTHRKVVKYCTATLMGLKWGRLDE